MTRGYVQPEVDASHGRELLTPKGISGSWGQPIWPLGQVHSLPGEVGLRPILRAQPKDPGQEASSYDYASGRRPSCQEQGAGWLCEGVSQDSQESGVRDSTGDEVLDERAISADHSNLAQALGPMLQEQQMMQQQMMMALQSRASGSHAAASQMPIQPHHHHDLTENDSWDDVMGNPNEWETQQGN